MTVATHYFKEIPVPQGPEEKCGICYGVFQDPTQNREVVAHAAATASSANTVFHAFHRVCLQPWITTKGKCPTCLGRAELLMTREEMQERLKTVEARLGDLHGEKPLDLLRVFVIGAIAILPITACVYYIRLYGYLALGIKDYFDFSWFWKGSWETRIARMGFNNASSLALASAIFMDFGIVFCSICPLRRERDVNALAQRERDVDALVPWILHQAVVVGIFALYCTFTWRGEGIAAALAKGRFTAFVITPLLSGISAAILHLFTNNFLGGPLPR